MRSPPIALVSLLLETACSSCVGTGTGTPATAARAGPPAGAADGWEAGGSARVDLTTIGVCRAVAALPLRAYGLDGDRPPVGGTSQLFPGNADCFAGGIRPQRSLTLVAVTDRAAAEVVRTANAQVTEFEAEGYPLAVLKPDRPANCIGVLDVHDGRFVWIAYGPASPTERPVTPQAELCETVPMIAASVVSALG